MSRRVRCTVAAMMLASLFSLPASGAPLAATDESAGQGQEEESPEPRQDNAVHEWLNGPARALLTVEEVRIAERLLATGYVAGGRGLAMAFLEPDGDSADSVDFLVLVRPSGAAGRAALLMKSADQPPLLVQSAEVGR